MTPAPKPQPAATNHHRYLADDDDFEEYEPVGLDGLLAASEKLLAINRNLAEPDDRDSLPNDRIYSVDRLMAERVKLDHNRTLRSLVGRMSRVKHLGVMPTNVFAPYTEGYLTGNPLTPALEEINPMHILEQKRRLTKMGPGGIGDPNAITLDMQSVSATQFGFIDPVAGPECFTGDHEVYTRRGWVRWDQITDGDIFACKVDGRIEWHAAERIVRDHYAGDMLVAENKTLRMVVTPNHRVIYKRDYETRDFSENLACNVEGDTIWIPARHEPEVGNPAMTHFELPSIEKTNNNQKEFEPFEIEDWCAYMGWFLSEGNCFMSKSDRLDYDSGRVCISQSVEANPENYAEIRDLCMRMGICDCDNGRTFVSGAKQLVAYFLQWDQGCYHKWIPVELFDAPIPAREALLHALLKGDGRWSSNRMCYCTVSIKLAEDVERLAFSLGYTAYIREEKDNRPDVLTTNYIVCIHRGNLRCVKGTPTFHSARGKSYPAQWSRQPHDGLVYCATVPGGQLHVRGKSGTSGYWTGNSEKAGIDIRLATGTKIGSDGKVYQIMVNRKTGKKQWVSPTDLIGKTLKLPD
jgi:hypothetical protein